MRADLPTGTVTFLFTDVEGSTKLLHDVGDVQYADLLATHHRQLREVWTKHGGVEVDTQGDAFFVAFARASDAVAAAEEAQTALREGAVRVRMGLHTGEPQLGELGYAGADVHRAARIAAAGHGGQVLLSRTTRDLVAVVVRDLGDNRLKDLSAPERIFQLGDDRFPPLKTLGQTNLPVQSTPLLGREEELAAVARVFAKGARVVTLTGVGGIGKTRVALQAAAELSGDFPDGVWFVPLAPVLDEALVEPAIARALDARGELHEWLRSRRLLLVLDNVEQLMPGVAAVIAPLPATVLVTSRERLGVHEEHEVPVAPLPRADAVALFVERARRLVPDFEPDEHVPAIVQRLDGLPLAIELAAARIKILAPAQIEQRLARSLDLLTTGASDVPERQRTLRAAIEWSYDLLEEDERRVLRALAVFRGSFTLEAAEAVAEADIESIARLVDKSLVSRRAGGRLALLATINEFLLGRLGDEREQVAARYAAYYTAWLPPHETESDQRLRELPDEIDNLRALVEWALAQPDPERAVAIVGAAAELWCLGVGNPAEPAAWLDRVLTLGASPSAALLRALTASAITANQTGEHVTAAEHCEAAIAMAESLGDAAWLLKAVEVQAIAHGQRGDVDAARPVFERALALARRSSTLHNYGTVEMWGGNHPRARKFLEESLAMEVKEGRLRRQSMIRHSLGDLRLREGDVEGATAEYGESLRIAHELNLPRTVALCAGGLAAVAALRGDAISAARLWGLAERLEDEIGRLDATERSYYLEVIGQIAQEPYEETRHVPADEALRLVNAYVHSI